jgi:hypothetical protein
MDILDLFPSHIDATKKHHEKTKAVLRNSGWEPRRKSLGIRTKMRTVNL